VAGIEIGIPEPSDHQRRLAQVDAMVGNLKNLLQLFGCSNQGQFVPYSSTSRKSGRGAGLIAVPSA
jgi:hypothetical protein